MERRASRAGAVGLVAGLALTWTIVFGVIAYHRHAWYRSYDFDMGLQDQSVWLIAHGRGFLTVRGLQVFGHHATPAYYLLAPFYRLGAGPAFLNLLQVGVIALGVVPLFLLGRARGIGPWPAALLASAYLLHPALQHFARELFHPEVVAITPLLCAYLCAVRRSWRWFAVWTILAVAWKEDVALVVVVLGLLIAWRGDRRIGLVTAAGALAWFVLVAVVVMPALNGGHVQPEGIYSGVGGGAGGILRTAVSDPTRITDRVANVDTLGYLWHLSAPFGLTAVLAPLVALLAVPQLVLNLLTDVPWTRTIEFHYAALPVAALGIALVESAGWVRRRLGRRAVAVLAVLVLACAAGSSYAWGPSPLARDYARRWELRRGANVDALQDAVAMVPADATVSASVDLVPHLGHRPEVYSYPNPWEPVNWGVPGSKTRDPRRVEWVAVNTRGLDSLERDRLTFRLGLKFEVVSDRDGVVVARRVRR